jgi:hypothetical protein
MIKIVERSILTMPYRTKTYIAADWDNDKDAVEQLYKWNDMEQWGLLFTNAHDLIQDRDENPNCSIKDLLGTELDVSKTFVLIVGENTKTDRSGACQSCYNYNGRTNSCLRERRMNYSSYTEYACDKAVRDGLKIVVLYNSATVNRSKCLDALKDTGTHVAMKYYKDGKYYWDYKSVKDALV